MGRTRWVHWGILTLLLAKKGCAASVCTCFQEKWYLSVQLSNSPYPPNIGTHGPNSARFGRGVGDCRMLVPYQPHKLVQLGKGEKTQLREGKRRESTSMHSSLYWTPENLHSHGLLSAQHHRESLDLTARTQARCPPLFPGMPHGTGSHLPGPHWRSKPRPCSQTPAWWVPSEAGLSRCTSGARQAALPLHPVLYPASPHRLAAWSGRRRVARPGS